MFRDLSPAHGALRVTAGFGPYRHLFPRAVRDVYLDTAAEGLPVPETKRALAAYHAHKELGTPGRRHFHAVEEEARALTAQLLGTAPANVCFLPSASDALLALLNSLHWRAEDQVIISDLEFPSNVIPWLRLREEGVEVTVVESMDGALRLDDILRCITARTKLVSLSLVSYKTGAYLAEVAQLAKRVREAGAILSIDATQALGRCPVAVGDIDFLFSSSFKWLMSTHGVGVTYVSPRLRERLEPRGIGWYSVPDCFTGDRFDRYVLKEGAACLTAGMPNFPALYALRASLRFLIDVGVAAISAHLRPLVARLREGVAATGACMLTPPHPEHASGIVSFAHSRPAAVRAALEQRGIVVWAGDGRVRASVHLYNDENDIDACVGSLKGLIERAPRRGMP
ncbi:MAG: aminotransferase class V-fold PLP-dependent enzyme [Luteitalea sp.]|nr:aminotransferase class V-fold PLP-dependent enzyme [Luteitalea sp.]